MRDDFLAEADEHLTGIRRGLLELESSVGKARPDSKTVESLFLELHSLKGISAIAGLASAEAVAHGTEDMLRLMRDGRMGLTAKGLEVLTAAAHKLEEVISAFRSNDPLPGCESLLASLRAQCELAPSGSGPVPAASGGLDADLLTKTEEAKARGLQLWVYTFTPAKNLDASGIGVMAIREELQKRGEILKATPRVRGKGALKFEFLIAARDTPTDLAEWERKGVSVQAATAENLNVETAPAGAGAQPIEHNPFLAPSHVVRVDLKRLDELMRITGEMVIHRSRLDTQLAKAQIGTGHVDLRGVREASGALSRSLKELREAIMRVRLVPVAEIFTRMPFVVRDLARQTQKKVKLELAGQDTAIDKYLIERLKDPLLHLVRNAFSHGVETAEERAASGKPEEATITLSASNVADSVIIRVKDDGRGINPIAIRERARLLGHETPESPDNKAILDFLCAPGFSTREDADRASGRGMGMTVVNTIVRELGGSLTLESEKGRFTQFTIRLPLTLAIAETLLVEAAGQKCAIPQSFVREILHATEDQVQMANGIEVISYREGVLPLVRLAGLFRLPDRPLPKMCLLVIASEHGSVGLWVEKVLGQREVVVGALRDPLIQVRGISGATELGDGKPVLILDGVSLTSGSVRPPERNRRGEETHALAIS
ncbi:MAG TPA: chemotaxis protein CheA [Verrucomicrobiae bacterium]|nr:chemotaxis protein CheA [Verrucomicrobiae bacterium]